MLYRSTANQTKGPLLLELSAGVSVAENEAKETGCIGMEIAARLSNSCCLVSSISGPVIVISPFLVDFNGRVRHGRIKYVFHHGGNGSRWRITSGWEVNSGGGAYVVLIDCREEERRDG
jgi:hypothetical protein